MQSRRAQLGWAVLPSHCPSELVASSCRPSLLILVLHAVKKQHQECPPRSLLSERLAAATQRPWGDDATCDGSAPFLQISPSVTGGFVQAAGKLQPQRLLCQGGAFHTCFAGTGSQPGFVNEPPVIRNRSTSSSPATQARPWCGLLLPARDRAARYCECCF